MIGIFLLVLVLLVMMVLSGKGKIEDANEQIKAEMGERYNPDLAGRPWRDSVMIVVATLFVLAAVVCASTPHLPLPDDNQHVTIQGE
jgi:hypothetical protein